MRLLPIRPAWAASLIALVLAFGFLGSRGIWDPDEGRYTNVALQMLDSGDWLNPKRHHESGHWTKPPLTYWAIAASVAVFGRNPWAARLPTALAFLGCIGLAWRLARRLAPGAEVAAAVIYATLLLPHIAAQLITTDYLLAFLQGLAMLGFVESRFGDPARSGRWLLLMWMAFALAFLTKGPPALLPLLAIVAYEWLVPHPERSRLLSASGALLFAVLALPWYIAVILGHPGLLEYYLGREVVDRFASNEFGRNGEWYGWIKVYLPALLIGSLPWTAALWRWLRGLPALLQRCGDREARVHNAAALLPMLWWALPLLVFCVARSRLPLYVLPLFLPIALAIARQRHSEARVLPRASLLIWIVALLGIRLAAAHWPSQQNAAQWAEAIGQRAPFAVREVVFVEDKPRYGLHLYLDTEVELIALSSSQAIGINPRVDQGLQSELAEQETGVVYIALVPEWAGLKNRIRSMGYEAHALGTPYHGRVLFSVRRAGETSVARPEGSQR